MYDSLIQAASVKWSVPVEWIKAVIQVESSWNPNAINPADPSYGLMQISAVTAQGYGIIDMTDLLDPAINIDVGTHLLSDLRHSYGDDFRAVYSAYNSGSPTLWETSTQVFANVQRAVSALASYTTQAVGSSGGLIVMGALAWFFFKRRR